MTTEELVYSRLSGSAPLAALVGDRISLIHPIEGTAYPAVSYKSLGAHWEYTHDGPEAWHDPVVQIDAWSDAASGAAPCVAVAREVLEALADDPANDVYFLIENDGHDFDEPARKLFRRMVQIRVWKKEAA